jgi:hypothetical protein
MRSFGKPLSRGAWLLMFALAAILPGCAASSLNNMWREPTYDAPDMKNVLVVALRPDPVRRRLWEDAFVRALKARGTNATPSYSMWANAAPDTQQVIEAIRANGYDGVVVNSRLADGVETSWTPGYSRREAVTRQNPWTGAYYTAWQDIEVPARVETQTVANFQTDVWSTGPGARLVWSGSDRTANNLDTDFINNRVLKVWVPEIAKSGIFPPAPKK